ncbi:MAG: ROK family protein [Leifsonia sp.]
MNAASRDAPASLGPGAAVLAFDVGGSDTKSAVVDSAGVLHGLRRTPTPLDTAHPAGAIIDHLAGLARDYAAEYPAVQPRAAGFLVPGLVDDDNGVGVFASNFGWRDAPFRASAEDRLLMPVAFSHDVRGAGEAEFRLGAARGYRDVAVLVIGTGIAGAFFIDGRAHVAGGYAGEIGHSIIIPGGPPCPCGGRGHLEAVASAGGIVRRYGERTGRAVSGARDVLGRARAGDAEAAVIWDEAVDGLALGLSQVVALLAPEAIVIGGGLAQAGAALFDPLERRLDELLTFHRRPELLPAQIGADAGLLGAALRARDLIAHPIGPA